MLRQGDSVLELYDAVATGDVPYPAHRPLSAELQDLFLRLLHRDPQHRITAAEVGGACGGTDGAGAGAGRTLPAQLGTLGTLRSHPTAPSSMPVLPSGPPHSLHAATSSPHATPQDLDTPPPTPPQVLHHPWVRGSVWQSAVREGSGEPGQAADQPAGERHPLVPYSAEVRVQPPPCE